MLRISRDADYAARTVLHLAGAGEGERITVREVAERRLIPKALIRRVVSRLAGAGILKTSRGRGGGIALARPASEISLLHVVEAIEGRIVLSDCVPHPKECPLSTDCPVRSCWDDTMNEIRNSLGRRSFADMVPNRGRTETTHPAKETFSSNTGRRREWKP